MVLVILFRSYVFEKQFINNNIMSAIAYPIETVKNSFYSGCAVLSRYFYGLGHDADEDHSSLPNN